MPETSVILQELLTALSGARQGTTLVLDQATLGPTSAASLVDLFTTELQITSFTLADVQLPASVTGTGFTAGSTVRFGTVAATAVTVSADGSLTVTAPAQAAGVVDVRVVTPYGTSPVATADRYTYLAR